MADVAIDPDVPPSGAGCVECLAKDGWWLHLRRCAACGHVACCDSSPSQHASRHAAKLGHPIARSFEPGEAWFWDYAREIDVDGPELSPPLAHPLDQPTPGPPAACRPTGRIACTEDVAVDQIVFVAIGGDLGTVGDAVGVPDRAIAGDLDRFKEYVEGRSMSSGAWRNRGPARHEGLRHERRSQNAVAGRTGSATMLSPARTLVARRVIVATPMMTMTPRPPKERTMCMNCGCGEAEKRHQPTDITKDDLQKAADGSGISMEETASNLRTSLDQLSEPAKASPTGAM